MAAAWQQLGFSLLGPTNQEMGTSECRADTDFLLNLMGLLYTELPAS